MRAWLRNTAGGLPGTYWYLWTGMLINRVGAFAMLIMSVYLTDERGASASLAGLVVGGYGIGGVAGTLLGGVLADHWGRRATLFWAHTVAAGLMAALAFTTHLGLIAALTVLLGLVHSMPMPAFVAAIVDVVPAERRSRAFNLQFWSFNLGMAAAGLLAGLLAQASYLALFLADAGATAVTAVVIAWKVPETFRRHAATRHNGGLLTALTDRTYLVFVGLTFLLAALSTQTSTIMPLAMRADGLSPAAYGTVVAISAALIVVGQLFVPPLIDGHRKHTVLATALGLIGIGFGALAFADHLAVYLLASVIWTIGSMLAAPPNAEVNAELSPEELRGRYQSVFSLTFPAAAFITPALGGLSLDHIGSWHWIAVGSVGLVAAVGHLLTGPSRDREAARRALAVRELERVAG
ncbi:MFS transporter [Asanoa ishikariensis]|uniref:Predicted arabinose efflux permease, MFS family n=1 Tax=Asanoa ishikariensis TaxID=137265 RepID=A0A1H3QJ64_9ACTN|nr:MFS transporter [Asanoa ishikariensis]GIF64953.1 MFS transporter [Asanoa ishikariensis]SDZ13654.1 Predicted arabinose efflux permease, MFS family [Asanoa ishikariensis]